MKVMLHKELGCFFRINNNVLEFSPLMIDSAIYTDEDFTSVDHELVGEEVVTIEGNDITLNEVYENVTKQLKESKQ